MSEEREGPSGGESDAAGSPPRTAIVLWDSMTLEVDNTGIRFGASSYRFDQLEDARLIAINPETIRLRLTGLERVALMPARPGGAHLVLEAIYRGRPDMRPTVPGPPPGYQLPLGAMPRYAPIDAPYAGPGMPPPLVAG